jgi:hypothetical protein
MREKLACRLTNFVGPCGNWQPEQAQTLPIVGSNPTGPTKFLPAKGGSRGACSYPI